MGMTFNNIHNDTTCNCIKDAIEDTASSFGIKTNKPQLKERDFVSKWEKGDIVTGDCKKICSKKGISVSRIDNTNKSDVINIFKEIFPISPTYKPFINVIKFYNESGLVKCSASIRNPYHCNFFKSDNFDYNKIIHIETISLSNV